jgi:hypothetical protein
LHYFLDQFDATSFIIKWNYRLVVAPIGSTIINDEGEEQTITKSTVGGIPSEGMFCDSKMLGWGSGSEGVAAQVPSECEVGSAPPKTKPGAPGKGSEESSVPAVEVQGLEKRKAKKAAKEAAKSEDSWH